MDILSSLYEYFFSYTGMGALGFLLCIVVSMLLFYKCKLEPVKFLFLFLCSVIPVYLGAKLFGILSLAVFKARSFLPFTLEDVKNAGIVFYGGLFAYMLYMRTVLPLFEKKNRFRVYNFSVLLAPLFHGFARIGCYCAHCCYGIISDRIFFSSFYEHRIPVQLIEAGFELFFFLILGCTLIRRKSRRLCVWRIYLYGYSAFRFIIEFFRGDEIRGFIGPLSFSQWLAIAVILFLLCTHKKKGGLLS